MGHRTMVHTAKKFVRGEDHSETADSVGSMLERARMGVWHRMGRDNLQRYRPPDPAYPKYGFSALPRIPPGPAC